MLNIPKLNIQEQETQKAFAASDMYRLLSMALRLPTEEISIGLLNKSLAEDVLTIFTELDFSGEEIEKTKTALMLLEGDVTAKQELLTEMRREYTRLFNHPEKPEIDIYESLFLFKPKEGDNEKPRLFVSPAALDAERCYRQAGLVRAKEVNEPGDHMATEMEFMAYLYWQRAMALQKGNQEELNLNNQQIKEFSKIHLRKWAVDFFERCASSSKGDAYRAFGQIGSLFIRNMLGRKIH